MTKKRGILGGTFDPFHCGHLQLAIEAYQQLNLDEVRLIPCDKPVHRDSAIASAQQRLQMVTLGCQDQPYLMADDREIKRTEPSFMINTLKSLQQDFPEDSLYLIIGTDAFECFSYWKDWDTILKLSTLIVAQRPGHAFKASTIPHTQLIIPDVDISSTNIREFCKTKKSIVNTVPEAVWQYIQTEELYEH